MIYENGNPIKQFDESELRFGLVWREVCLPPEMYDRWITEEDTMDTNNVLNVLLDKMKNDGIQIPDDGYELVELILKTFVTYPFGDGIIPYNYCILPYMVPSYAKSTIQSLLSPICAQSYSN